MLTEHFNGTKVEQVTSADLADFLYHSPHRARDGTVTDSELCGQRVAQSLSPEDRLPGDRPAGRHRRPPGPRRRRGAGPSGRARPGSGRRRRRRRPGFLRAARRLTARRPT
jgi:hypothetical protein